jgi:hypothetical protein
VTLPAIPWDIDDNKRVSVLNDIGAAVKSAGGTLNALDRTASYSHSDLTARINDIITAANGLGAVPVMKTYVSIDYNAFTSVISKVAAGIATIP